MEGKKEGIFDLIKFSSNKTKEKLVNTLYKSIENAYKNFQVDIQEVFMNEKKENWSAVNLNLFHQIEKLLRNSEV
ncbi:MAG: hypothetical protein ACTSV5_07335 [Promethearchaeota archaeon]